MEMVMQHTRETITALLLREDTIRMHPVCSALLVLLRNQTQDEKAHHTTKYRNMTGFTPSDAKRGTGMAQWYAEKGFLTPKQMAYWQAPAKTFAKRIRIAKYWRQMLDAAHERQEQREFQIWSGETQV